MANQLIMTATQILRQNGVTNHAVVRELTRSEKNLMGDLKLLLNFSHNGFKTDPILRNGGDEPMLMPTQRLRRHLCHLSHNLASQQAPQSEASNVTPCRLCRRFRNAGEKRYIKWAIVLNQFRRLHPQVNSSDDQIKNRYKLLVRKGEHNL